MSSGQALPITIRVWPFFELSELSQWILPGDNLVHPVETRVSGQCTGVNADGFQQVNGMFILEQKVIELRQHLPEEAAARFEENPVVTKNRRNRNHRNVVRMQGMNIVIPEFVLDKMARSGFTCSANQRAWLCVPRQVEKKSAPA